MKAGISSYSLVRALESGEMTILDAIDWVAEQGGEHIEIVPAGFNLTENPELIPAMRSRAAERGIDLSNYAINAEFNVADDEAYEQEINRVMKQVDIAHELGIKLMRHDVATSKDPSIVNFNKDLERLASACRRIADYAAKYDITTSVENHGSYVQSSDRVKALVYAVDRPNFRTTIDVGNFLGLDENPVGGTRNNISIASMIHIKDLYIRSLDPGENWGRTRGGVYIRSAILGYGDIDMRSVLRIIKQSGYDGYLSVEFEGMEECKMASAIGLRNLRRLWNEV